MISSIIYTHRHEDGSAGTQVTIANITEMACYPGEFSIEIATGTKVHYFRCKDKNMYNGLVNIINEAINRKGYYWVDVTVDLEEDLDDTFGRFYNVVVGYTGGECYDY